MLFFSLALPGMAALAMQEATLAETVLADNLLTNNLPENDAEPAIEATRALPEVSIVDLSLFGVIALGIIGLLWIRRHTSEL